MHPTTITLQVRRFIVQNYLLGEDNGFQETDSFLECGIIDSTGILELVAFIQETYNITIEDEELIPENFDSISNVSAFLGRKTNSGAEATIAAVQQAVTGEHV